MVLLHHCNTDDYVRYPSFGQCKQQVLDCESHARIYLTDNAHDGGDFASSHRNIVVGSPIKGDLAGVYEVLICRGYSGLEALGSASAHRAKYRCERCLAVGLNDAIQRGHFKYLGAG